MTGSRYILAVPFHTQTENWSSVDVRFVVQRLGTGHIPLQVDYELILKVSPQKMAKMKEIMPEPMSSTLGLSVPLKVEFKVCPTWGGWE